LGDLFDLLNIPFGYVISFAYYLTSNYAIALLVFAIIVKVVLFTFGIKQQKNMQKQSKLRPKEELIRKKYAGRTDKVTTMKMNEEMQKLYQEEHFNPLSGCLPLLIQLPILFSLYNIVREPLTYIAHYSSEMLEAIKNQAVIWADAGGRAINGAYAEIDYIREINLNPSSFEPIFEKFGESFDSIPDLNLFGGLINLGDTASLSNISWIIIIPILTFITAFFGQKITRKYTYQSPAAQGQGSGKTMNIMMPLFSVYISFIVPSALALYWIYQNILSPIQQIILAKLYPVVEMTPEEIKAAEKVLQGKTKHKKQHLENADPSSTPKRRSLVYDDDDDETPIQAQSTKTKKIVEKKDNSNNKSAIEKAPLQDEEDK